MTVALNAFTNHYFVMSRPNFNKDFQTLTLINAELELSFKS